MHFYVISKIFMLFMAYIQFIIKNNKNTQTYYT